MSNADQKQPSWAKGLWWHKLLGAIACVAAFYGAKEAVYSYVQSSSSAPQALHDLLVKAATQINATLPKQLNENTTLLNISVEGNNLIYHHQLPSGFTITDMNTLRNNIVQKVCSSDMRKQIAMGTSYTYEYSTPERVSQGSFTISSCT